MDLLILEPLEPEVLQWMQARHAVRLAPELARDPVALRQALPQVRGLIVPASVPLDAQLLRSAPQLRAVGRLSAGAEQLDAAACARANVEVVRPNQATAVAEAEFVIGALLQMLRRVPVVNADGLQVGRELGACVVGVLGLTPAARPLARLLSAFGATVLGYEPSVHPSEGTWERVGGQPVGLRELVERSDAVCVLLPYYSRYHGLLGERLLQGCKPDQVLVSLAYSGLFDDAALAEVLSSGRMAAAWFDSMEPGLRDEGRALHGAPTLQVTPYVASTTRESRLRSAWAVARRMDELLSEPPARPQFRASTEGALTGLAGGPAPA